MCQWYSVRPLYSILYRLLYKVDKLDKEAISLVFCEFDFVIQIFFDLFVITPIDPFANVQMHKQ